MRWLLVLALFLFVGAAVAQQSNYTPGLGVIGIPVTRSTLVTPTTIVSANVFQIILNSTANSNVTIRGRLEIQNNNSVGTSCFVFFGSTNPTTGNSIILGSGGLYTREFPYIPSDTVQATCGANNSSLFVGVE